MKKYRCLLVDDEYKVRSVLRTKLEKLCPEINIVAEACDVPEARQMITDHSPDIVFLDISMPGETGLDLLRSIEPSFQIIFATGHHEYGLDALKLAAVDYILKPFRSEDLRQAVDRAVVALDQKDRLDKYEALISNIDQDDRTEQTLAIAVGSNLEYVKLKRIIRFEGWQRYTKIYCDNGDHYLSSYNLGHYVKMLHDHDFYLCHKSHFINISRISRYNKEGFVYLGDENPIPVSRRKRGEFVTEVLSATS